MRIPGPHRPLGAIAVAVLALGCDAATVAPGDGGVLDARTVDAGLDGAIESDADLPEDAAPEPDAAFDPCPEGTSRVAADCLDVDVPRFAFEVVGWTFERAYPGLLYTTRIAVRGGEYPYRFRLLSAPEGMTIDASGRIAWTPAAGERTAGVSIETRDSVGARLTHELSIEVTEAGFHFVAADGSDGADGSLAHPWATLEHASETGAASDAVYVRAGTYTTRFEIDGSGPMVWMAYPGEAAVLDAEREVGMGIHSGPDGHVLIAGFEMRNVREKMFWMGGHTHHLVFRDNEMHDLVSSGANNPAFLFFEDDDARPVEGRVQYDDVVVQDNLFYDLRNDITGGAALSLYNVQGLLFEDNEVHHIEGRCVGDKDDGFQNVYRHNVCHDTPGGIRLENQYTQAEIEVSHNLFYAVGDGVTLSWQPGWIRDVWIHHNTIVDAPLVVRWAVNEPMSANFNIYRNVIVRAEGPPISADEPAADDALEAGRLRYDGNLYFTGDDVLYSARWNARQLDFAEWQALGHDPDGVFADPMLEDMTLPASSPYFGIFGRLDP